MEEKKKLDGKDVKILSILSENSRLPTVEIARRVGLSREVVDYRIKGLLKKQIITEFITLLNLEKMGYQRATFLLQFQKADAAKEKEILDYLTNHPFIGWSGLSPGKWNFISDIVGRDQSHMYGILKEILGKYGQFISEYRIYATTGGELLAWKYYGETGKYRKAKKIKKHSLDLTDIRILKILSRNARLDYVSFSRQINLTPNGIRKRIANLINADIIKDFIVVTNLKEIGYAMYDIMLKFENMALDKEAELMTYLKGYPFLIYYFTYFGEWNLEVGMLIQKTEELSIFMMNLRNKFAGIVKIMDISPIFDEIKAAYVPDGVFTELLKKYKT